MQYNKCNICGADSGRAGMLISTQGAKYACLNCHDTFLQNKIVIHSNLSRTKDEIERTFKLLK